MEEALKIIVELEGIIGAIFGSAATLITTEILRNKGNLKIFVININEYYKYSCLGGITRHKTKDTTMNGYAFEIKLNVYNKSDISKIMREIGINIYNNNEYKFKRIIKDDSTMQMINHMLKCENATLYNLESKKVYELNFSVFLTAKDLEVLNDKVKLELTYKNEKNRIKKIEIFNQKLKTEDEIENLKHSI